MDQRQRVKHTDQRAPSITYSRTWPENLICDCRSVVDLPTKRYARDAQSTSTVKEMQTTGLRSQPSHQRCCECNPLAPDILHKNSKRLKQQRRRNTWRACYALNRAVSLPPTSWCPLFSCVLGPSRDSNRAPSSMRTGGASNRMTLLSLENIERVHPNSNAPCTTQLHLYTGSRSLYAGREATRTRHAAELWFLAISLEGKRTLPSTYVHKC